MQNFVQGDRTQPYLLPPDLREWLPADDLAHFVVAAVERVPLSEFRVNTRGTDAKPLRDLAHNEVGDFGEKTANHPPTSDWNPAVRGPLGVDIDEDTFHVYRAEHFHFRDADPGDELANIRIA